MTVPSAVLLSLTLAVYESNIVCIFLSFRRITIVTVREAFPIKGKCKLTSSFARDISAGFTSDTFRVRVQQEAKNVFGELGAQSRFLHCITVQAVLNPINFKEII